MAMTTTQFYEREISIPAEPARLAEARSFATSAAAEMGFDEREQYLITTAANEAVSNAVEHGSASAADTVRLRVTVEGNDFALYVFDLGEDFRRKEGPVDQAAERGRGLSFMDRLMDRVDVKPGSEGTVIRLSKKLAA